MNTAEWIIALILAVTLFVFLIIGIILFIKLIDLSREVKIVVKTSQDIAEKTEDVVENVRDFTSIGGIAKAISHRLERKGIEVEFVEKQKPKSAPKNAKPEKK
ncbi:hypothetical protein IJG20_01520 [Candidatus Saccharibacteria bacterium]|nr:hypothetical protein [Candidatus Saccharibacteria bacterium]MBQ3430766.1 hypothetical protein [Candidatus Saccharibacteria bacterium]